MTSPVANTEWEGEFSKIDGTLMSIIRVRFETDGTSQFKVRRQVGDWGNWKRIWNWKERESSIQFGALGERVQRIRNPTEEQLKEAEFQDTE